MSKRPAIRAFLAPRQLENDGCDFTTAWDRLAGGAQYVVPMLLSSCSQTKIPPGSVDHLRSFLGLPVSRRRRWRGRTIEPRPSRARVRVPRRKRGRPRSTRLLVRKRRRPGAGRPRARDTAPIPEAMTYTPAEFSRIGLIDNVFYGKSAEGGFEGTCYQKQSLRSDRPRDLVRRPKHQDNDRRLGKQTRKQNVVVVSLLLHPKSGRFRPATHGPAVSGCRAGRAPGPARPQGRPAGRGAARRRRRAGRAPAGASAPVTGRGAGPCASAGASALVLVAAQLPRATDWGMLGFGAGHGAAAGDDNMAQ